MSARIREALVLAGQDYPKVPQHLRFGGPHRRNAAIILNVIQRLSAFSPRPRSLLIDIEKALHTTAPKQVLADQLLATGAATQAEINEFKLPPKERMHMTPHRRDQLVRELPPEAAKVFAAIPDDQEPRRFVAMVQAYEDKHGYRPYHHILRGVLKALTKAGLLVHSHAPGRGYADLWVRRKVSEVPTETDEEQKLRARRTKEVGTVGELFGAVLEAARPKTQPEEPPPVLPLAVQFDPRLSEASEMIKPMLERVKALQQTLVQETGRLSDELVEMALQLDIANDKLRADGERLRKLQALINGTDP